MASILIKNGRVIDPASDLDAKADVLIRDGKIAEVGKVSAKADETIDASGHIVCPGLIDMHVHLREPGGDGSETIASGLAAAVAGGFTAVAAMPNTEPPCDSAPAVEYVYLHAVLADTAKAYPVAAITKGRRGEELAELGTLAGAGAVAFSDDGDPVARSDVMLRAMAYAAMLDTAVLSHCEDPLLSAGGVMHEGAASARLGLAGIPAASEIVAVSRDVALAEATGADLHVQHVSVAGAVEIIRRAKARGVGVTAEATTHHLTLTDDCLLERDDAGMLKFDTNYKMNPPLRSKADVEALRAGLRDGTIDCIVSDHAPHAVESKSVEFNDAAFGIVGLETTLPVVVTELIEPGILDWPGAVRALTVHPAEILGIPKGTLAVGADADVTLIDPDCEWTIDANAFRSKSRNTPFDGKSVKGRAVCVIVEGDVKMNLL